MSDSNETVISLFQRRMCGRLLLLLIALFLRFHCHRSNPFSACIPNTSCQCHLTAHSFTFLNCSQTLTDLPIFHSQNVINVTRLMARNAFVGWPLQLCKYSKIQILDLSGSNLNSSLVDFSCLKHLIHVNLSQTQLTQVPQFGANASQNLQILDLSNNRIKRIDAGQFRSMTNLMSLFLQNNPIASIEHLEELFYLPHLESMNLISTDDTVSLQPSITSKQWTDIARQWSSSKRSFVLRLRNIPFQSFLPPPSLSSTPISSEAMKTILTSLLNSTLVTPSITRRCQCTELRAYQRLFSSIDSMKKYSSALFESTTCLMPDGLTHARLFDRRTHIDLRCPFLGKKSFFSLLPPGSAASLLTGTVYSSLSLLPILFFSHY